MRALSAWSTAPFACLQAHRRMANRLPPRDACCSHSPVAQEVTEETPSDGTWPPTRWIQDKKSTSRHGGVPAGAARLHVAADMRWRLRSTIVPADNVRSRDHTLPESTSIAIALRQKRSELRQKVARTASRTTSRSGCRRSVVGRGHLTPKRARERVEAIAAQAAREPERRCSAPAPLSPDGAG